MKIGIIITKPRLEENLLINELKKKKVETEIIFDDQIVIDIESSTKSDLDIVLNRSLSAFKSELILAYFDSLGTKTINSYFSTVIANNKFLTSLVLTKNKIPTIKTAVAFGKEKAMEIIGKFGYPVVIKPIIGSWGRLATKIDDQTQAHQIIEHKLALSSLHHQALYIQEYVFKPDRDIRVLVLGQEAICAMYRTSKNWITNTAVGGKPIFCQITKEIEKISCQTTQALNIDVAGIDLVETTDGLKVLEVNAGVEFHGLMETTKINIPKLITNYILKKYG